MYPIRQAMTHSNPLPEGSSSTSRPELYTSGVSFAPGLLILLGGRIQNMSEVKEPCGNCGHSLSSHIRNIREAATMRVDDALLGKKPGDIFSDKPVGESGCTECSCSRWIPAWH